MQLIAYAPATCNFRLSSKQTDATYFGPGWNLNRMQQTIPGLEAPGVREHYQQG